MKTTKVTMIIMWTILFLGIAGFFQANLEGAPQKEELRQDSKDPEVVQELEEPDGASIKFLPDGEWRIYSRGTGIYDFDDADDRQDALREATLKAKANIAKFLKEKVKSEETLDNITKKMKKMEKKAGAKAAGSVKKEQIKTMTERISVNADAILRGVLVLETTKLPNGDGGGTIHVTLGVSSKSSRFAQKVEGQIKNPRAHAKSGAASGKKKDKKVKKKSKTDW